jgi:hypothetical protein
MKRYFGIISLVIALQGCQKREKDVAGIYVKSPSVNTIDSLFLYADSLKSTKVYNRKVYRYTQRFYNKKMGQLLFENTSTWWINDKGRIELDNLYLDEDNNPDDYSHSQEAIKNAVISCSLPFRGSKLIVNEDAHVFYSKIK